MLEVLGMRYTGSGVLASALAMDKALSKRVLAGASASECRKTFVLKHNHRMRRSGEMRLPVIVKPNAQGSTIGMSIVREASELDAATELAFQL